MSMERLNNRIKWKDRPFIRFKGIIQSVAQTMKIIKYE